MVNAARRAIESLYTGRCTVIEYRKIKKANKSTGFEEVTVIENQPCRLSYSRVTKANETESATEITQTPKVFLPPELQIKPGSKLVISQNGRTTEFKNSGEPAVYSTHQEIMLELFKGWT